MRIRAVILATVIAGAAAVVPASATAPRIPPPPDLAIPVFQRALAGGDVDEVLAARRAMLTASRADGGSGFQAVPQVDGGGRPSSFPLSWGFPAADLDGDGLDDAFVLHLGETPEMLLTARRGRDGSVLWSAPLAWPADGGYWGAVAFMDVAGDAAQEVVVYREHLEGQRSDGIAWIVRAQSLHQRLEVLDAGTGEPLYVREETATIEQVFIPAMFALRLDDLLVSVQPAGDLGGSPSPELLLGWLDHRSVSTIRVNDVPPRSMEETFAAELVDVSNGEILATVNETHPGGIFVVAAGDLDGDGRGELLALSTDAASERGLVRARGVDGSVLWVRDMDAPVYPAFPDYELRLADAGSVDVVVTVLGRFEYRTLALRGEDGADLWSIEGDLWFRPAGDVDGDGGVELMVSGTIAVGASAASTERVAVQMLDGATLTPFWQRLHVEDEDTTEYGCLECSQDFTGDGVLDPILGGRIAEGNVMVRYHVALDGADGGELWETSTTGRMAETDPLDGDVNGNGINDVLITRELRDGRSWSLSIQVADGADLAPIWAIVLPAPGRPLWMHGFAANLVEGVGLELVTTASAEMPDHMVERVLALGPGGLLWSA